MNGRTLILVFFPSELVICRWDVFPNVFDGIEKFLIVFYLLKIFDYS